MNDADFPSWMQANWVWILGVLGAIGAGYKYLQAQKVESAQISSEEAKRVDAMSEVVWGRLEGEIGRMEKRIHDLGTENALLRDQVIQLKSQLIRAQAEAHQAVKSHQALQEQVIHLSAQIRVLEMQSQHHAPETTEQALERAIRNVRMRLAT